MVHEREDNMTCGPIMLQGEIQALKAMLFTSNRINNMKLLNVFNKTCIISATATRTLKVSRRTSIKSRISGVFLLTL
jgi:hypothetical protein